MSTIDQIRGRWGEVFHRYGLPPINPRKHYAGECPMCGKKGKLRIDDKDGDGTWVCVCGAGTGIQLVMAATGKDFKTVADEIDRDFGLSRDISRPAPSPSVDKQLRAANLFRSGLPLRGTVAQTYLNDRGVFEMPTGGVKLCDVFEPETNRVLSAMFAIASDEFSRPLFSHVTYLEDGAKANIDTVRRMHSLVDATGQSASVKLQQASDVLGVAEGIESALSAHQTYKLPVWATLNATLMKRFRAPAGVKTLYIFADNDSNGTGLAAAFECANRNLLSKNDVTSIVIRWPETLNDFNDTLSEPDRIVEWKLSR